MMRGTVYTLLFVLLVGTVSAGVCEGDAYLECKQKNSFDKTSIVRQLDDMWLVYALSDADNPQDKLAMEITRRMQIMLSTYTWFNNESIRWAAAARNRWWDYHGYTSEETRVQFFQDGRVLTQGFFFTEFPIDLFKGGYVDYSGCLTYGTTFKACGVEIRMTELGMSFVNPYGHGYVVMDEPFTFSDRVYLDKDSDFFAHGRTYRTEGAVLLRKLEDDAFSTNGAPVSAYDDQNKKIWTVKGSAVFREESVQLGIDSTYEFFRGDKVTRAYETQETGAYVMHTEGGCDPFLFPLHGMYYPSQYCIEDVTDAQGKVHIMVQPARESTVLARIVRGEVASMRVNPIADDSTFILDQYGNTMTFASTDITTTGDPVSLFDLEATYLGSTGMRTLSIKSGEMVVCEGDTCKTFGTHLQTRAQYNAFVNSGRSAQTTAHIRDTCNNQVQDWYLRYALYPEVSKAVVSAASQVQALKPSPTGISMTPEYVYVGAVAEGLDRLFDTDTPQSSWPGIINGYSFLGLDTFGSNYPSIQAGGYLPRHVTGYTERELYYLTAQEIEQFRGEHAFLVATHTNELEQDVVSGMFFSLDKALLAKAAEGTWRQQQFFIRDLERLGINPRTLQDDEVMFWTQVYYNVGQGGGRQMLESYHEKGYMQDLRYVCQRPDEYWENPHLYASRRVANLRLIREANLFSWARQ